MATVGVRELKAHLSAYLKRVAEGEHITVTDHGRPVATLAPLTKTRDPLMALVDQGRASWNGGKPSNLTTRRLVKIGASLSDAVLEDRG